MRDERGLNRDRDLDALLDQAFSSYADQEPDGALRARITARLAEVAPSRSLHMWAFSGVAACVATVALTFFLLHPQTNAPLPHAVNVAPLVVPATASSTLLQRSSSTAIEHTRALKSARPAHTIESATLKNYHSRATDDALTEEDRILLKFVAEHPRDAQKMLTPPEPQSVEVKPITIASIQIVALSDSGQNKPSPIRSEQ